MSKNDTAIPEVAAAMDNLRLAIGRTLGALKELDLDALPKENQDAIQRIIEHAGDTVTIKEFDFDGMYGRTYRATRGIFSAHANRPAVPLPESEVATVTPAPLTPAPASPALDEKLKAIRDAHLEAFSGANRCAHLLRELMAQHACGPEVAKLAEAMAAITKQLDGYPAPNGCNTYRDVTRLGKLLSP